MAEDPLPVNSYKFPPYAYEKCFEVYGRTNSRIAAADACGVSLSTINRRLVQDPAFKEGMLEAKSRYIHTLEAEAHRRAVEGVTQEKPGPGGVIFTVTAFSDALLLHMLKKADPAKHGDKVQIDQTVQVENPVGLESLSKDNRDRLKIILESAVDAEIVETKELENGS